MGRSPRPAWLVIAIWLLAGLALLATPAPVQAAASAGSPVTRLAPDGPGHRYNSFSAGVFHVCAIRPDGTLACWGANGWGETLPPPGAFVKVSAGAAVSCAIRSDGELMCWGHNGSGGSSPPPGQYIDVSAGESHVCGILGDGTLRCWGWNQHGQLNAPPGTFRQVRAGYEFSCGLRTDGTLACWGGQGLYDYTPPAGTYVRLDIGAWNSHACAIRADGAAVCWGTYADSQKVVPSMIPGPFLSTAPGLDFGCGLKVDGTLACWGDYVSWTTLLPGSLQEIEAGWDYLCGLTTDGHLVCGGDNAAGQGMPPVTGYSDVAAGIEDTCALRPDGSLDCWGYYSRGYPAPAGTFRQVSTPSTHFCALRTTGTAVCWGENAFGQAIAPGGTFDQVSTGGHHSCGLRTDGSITCWGDPAYGQSTPPAGTFTQVSVGNDHTCALKADGTAACWGHNNYGQASPPAGTFISVGAGTDFSCGLRPYGTVACWGNNADGQSSPPSGAFAQLSVGFQHACALRADGSMACWGWRGYCGIYGTCELGSALPGTFLRVSAGGSHNCAIRTDGTLTCWGSNYFGEGLVPGGPVFGRAQVSAGGEHNCTRRPDGTLACWGRNDRGQATPPAGAYRSVSAGDAHTCALAGNGTATCWGDNASSKAQPVAGALSELTAGRNHTCALKSDNTAACWGENTFGQATPITATLTQISAGDNHTCGLRLDGKAACWGDKTWGQASPITATLTQISAGGQFTCGLTPDGRAACWGDTTFGQTSPPATAAFTQLSAGREHACGLQHDGAVACWGRNDAGQATPPAGTFIAVSAGGRQTCATRTDGIVECWGDNAAGQTPQIALAPATLPAGQAGTAYTQTLSAIGSQAPYTFTLTSGSLPAGLTLDPSGKLAGTPRSAGPFSITVQAIDAAYLAGTQSYTLVIDKAASTVVLTGWPSPLMPGRSVTFTATVSGPAGVGVPTGTVTFMEDIWALGSVTLDDQGQAVLTVSSLRPGVHKYTASYSGDANLEASISASWRWWIDLNPDTATTLSASPNPARYGQTIGLTATVTAEAGTPTGVVTLTLQGRAPVTRPVSGGSASYSLSGLPAGTYTAGAEYGGDASHLGSAATLSGGLVVAPAPLTVRPNDATIAYGQPLPAFTLGYDGLVNGDTAASLTGAPSFSITATQTSEAGSYVVTPGGLTAPNYEITFQNGTLTITPAPTALTLSGAPNPALVGRPLTLTATVSTLAGTATPTGTVTFYEGETLLESAELDAHGRASITLDDLALGAHTLTAHYAEGRNYDPSTGETSVTIADVAIAGLAASSSSPTTLGDSTAFSATIQAGSNVTYTWDFGDGATGSGAQVSHTYAAPGSYPVTVTAANSQARTEASLTVQVLKPEYYVYLPLALR